MRSVTSSVMLGANRRSRREEMLSIPTDFPGSRFIKMFLTYSLPTGVE